VARVVNTALEKTMQAALFTLHEGGQALIAVADNGIGMSRDELSLAIERHCTSKLPDDDLLDIALIQLIGRKPGR